MHLPLVAHRRVKAVVLEYMEGESLTRVGIPEMQLSESSSMLGVGVGSGAGQ